MNLQIPHVELILDHAALARNGCCSRRIERPRDIPVKHAVEREELVEGGSKFLGAPGGRARKAVLNRDGPSAPTSTWSRTSQQCTTHCRADFGQLHVKVGTGVVSKRWGPPEFDLLDRVAVTGPWPRP